MKSQSEKSYARVTSSNIWESMMVQLLLLLILFLLLKKCRIVSPGVINYQWVCFKNNVQKISLPNIGTCTLLGVSWDAGAF